MLFRRASLEHGPWSGWRLGEGLPPTRYERYEEWLSSLSDDQRSAWERLEEVWSNARMLEYGNVFRGKKNPLAGLCDNEIRGLLNTVSEELTSQLSDEQMKELEEAAVPELTKGGERPQPFDVDLANRWIFDRVISLGWRPDLHSSHDDHLPYDGRSAHKAERIGKKYQWIAFHEFLARVCDNFEFFPDWYHPKAGTYEGTWQFSHGRDIDPSMCLRSTCEREHLSDPCWWAPTIYDPRQVHDEDEEWLRSVEDWPELSQFVDVQRPDDDTPWLVLQTFVSWLEKERRSAEGEGLPRRDSWFMTEAHLVRREHLDEVLDWAKRQNFMGRWMPESGSFYDVHIGEYPWARSWRERWGEPEGPSAWSIGHEGREQRIPHPILVTNHQYLCEKGALDCSVNETVSFRVPSPWLIRKMQLKWHGKEGEYRDRTGELLALDPSVREKGPSVLLIRRDRFLRFLDEEVLAVFWVALGEKRILTESHRPEDWKGQHEISIVGWWADDGFQSYINPYFRAPGDYPER